MNPNPRIALTLSCSLLALAGCAPEAGSGAQERVGATEQALDATVITVFRVIGYNYDLAGRDLNGTALNGKVLDGHIPTGISADGATLDGAPMQSTSLVGSELQGVDAKGKHKHGDKMVGAVFHAILDDAESLEMRLDSLEAGTHKWDQDVMRYEVSYPTQNGRMPLCGVGADGKPIKVIVLSGRWDYAQGAPSGGSHVEDPAAYTFACDEYALAKCVELGYKPWQPAKACVAGQKCQKITLADLHQSCTRMLRADYCGDGTSYTVDGTELNAYDAFGIRTDAMAWAIEAEWAPAGALCVARERIPSAGTPPCAAALDTPACGDPAHLGTGALLISEIAPSAQ